MPNTDNPHGLRPLMRNLDGGEPFVEKLSKIAGYGTGLFQWDPVNRVADGSIEKSITPGTTLITGVNLVHGAASKATDHLVITSATAVFEAQDNNSTDGLAAADMGANANLEMNAGSALTGISGVEINEGTVATTASLDVKLLRKLEVPDNDWGAWCRVEIVINKHRMHGGAAGV